MKKHKRVLSIFLILTILLLYMVPVHASENSLPKEEVVYVMMDASGSVQGVYVVNAFGSGAVTDYGNYSAVKMLNTNDPMMQSGDAVTFTTTAEKAYYQGTLSHTEIPWEISIRYFMDGVEYNAKEIAGMSGVLQMQISIKQNTACNPTFFENYALQASVTLDTELCTDIEAEGATLASAGKDKKLSYIILPETEKDISITANVTGFEMDPIEMVGILLNIGDSVVIDANSFNLSDYENSIIDLQDGAVDLDDGADELYDGVVDMKNGTSDLAIGATDLYSGLSAINENSGDILAGAQLLANESFASATTQLRDQLVAAGMSEAEAAQITLTQSTYISVLAQLAGAAPTESQISLAETNIRNGLSASGMTNASVQSLTMTLADTNLTQGYASTVSDAVAQAGVIMAEAAYVQTAVATYSTSADPLISATVSGMVSSLMADPYHMNISAATAVACIAIARDTANPTAQIPAAITLVQHASSVPATASAESIRALCITAVQEEMVDAADEFTALKTKLDGVASFLSGLKSYTDGVSTAALGAESLATGASSLNVGAADLLVGAEKLADGTGELQTETGNFDSDISGSVQEQINDKIAAYSAEDYIPVSFASEKNTNVESIQFVIKTAAVEIPKVDIHPDEPAEPLNFWQKLLRLFGLN